MQLTQLSLHHSQLICPLQYCHQSNEDLFFYRQTVTLLGSPLKCISLNISIPKAKASVQFFSGVLLQWFCMLNIHPLTVSSSTKMVVAMLTTTDEAEPWTQKDLISLLQNPCTAGGCKVPLCLNSRKFCCGWNGDEQKKERHLG